MPTFYENKTLFALLPNKQNKAMRKYILLFYFFLSISISAQVSDNFLDNDFSNSPEWKGNAEKFIVNTSQQLQLNATAENGNAYLSTTSEVTKNASWECFVKIAFTPSSSNLAKIYLISDKEDLTAPLNGYYILIGNATKDISLYRQEGATSTKIIDGTDNRLNSSINEIFIKATRSSTGEWKLSSKLLTETEYYTEGTAIDSKLDACYFSGIVCKYTPTRSTEFYFDDFLISGDLYEPPVLPTYKAIRGDIVFNELMVKPTPTVGLPDAEYIELYNNTNEAVNLQNFTLNGFSKTCTFPLYVIQPNDFVVVCSKTVLPSMQQFGNCIGLENFPPLTNSSGLLSLYNAENELISWVEYSENWLTDPFKKNGGWSLECIDPTNFIGNSSNWNSSQNPQGGTPNATNSIQAINEDVTEPIIKNIDVIDNQNITLYFDKPMNTSLLSDISKYILSPITNLSLATSNVPQGNTVSLQFAEKLQENTVYTLQIPEIKDVNGNKTDKIYRIAIPEDIEPNDIIINEVLFNPYSNGVDFVEIYNRSDKVLNLKQLMLTNKNSDGKLNAFPVIAPNGFLIFPQDYVVLTTEKQAVCNFYTCPENDHFLEINSFPSFPDNEGTVLLTTLTETIIDEFSYSEKFHHALINNPEGVSLERISFNRPSNEASNWHSGSFNTNYATPGYKNAHTTEKSTSDAEIWLSPKTFSPDNDGQEDILTINYKFTAAGYIANLTIYDANGNKVKQLYNNALLSDEGSTTWDGTDEQSKVAPVGIYIAYFEAFKTDGSIVKEKMAFVLSAKK